MQTQPPTDLAPALTEPAEAPATRLTLETVEGCMALQKLGEMFAHSTVVPKDYRDNVSNCILALDIASRMQMSPMMVFQNMYVISGKPSWSSSFIIAAFNHFAADKFGPMVFEFFGQEGTPQRGCRAYAVSRATREKVYGPAVTIGMAMAERWGQKWRTMPELMLRYRAAAFFVRTTCPEILFGLYTQEEQEDIIHVEAPPAPPPPPLPPPPHKEPPRMTMEDAFIALGITPDMLAARLGHDIASCTPEETGELRKIYADIRKNPDCISTYFPSAVAEEAVF